MTYFSNTRQVTVEWGQCDPAGIVFNPHFFEYFDASTVLLFEKALGMKKIDMMRTFDGDFPLVDARAKFLIPARFGDVVEITSQIAEFKRSSFRVHHVITNQGKLAVDGQETRVWVGLNVDDPAGIKSRPIPEAIISRLKTA
jgi:4-hydroxybenzoyl-CoA thioesterase